MIEETMSGITIEVNGISIATISLAGMEVVRVSVDGALDLEQKATLSAMGGDYSEGGCGHLIWIAERCLLPNDVLSVRWDETCTIATQGKTIDELYPAEEPLAKSDFSTSEEWAAEIRARPRLHEGFIVQVETSSALQAKATSDDLNTNFAFSLSWDRFRPDQARVRLATYCLDDILARTAGTEHLQTTLSFGESSSFLLVR